MHRLVERLRSEPQAAAIDLSTCALHRTISKSIAEDATPLLQELLQTGMSKQQGAAASALARLARDHPDIVRGIEPDLNQILRDGTVYQDHYYTATQAVSAFAALEAESWREEIVRARTWYREQGAQRAWAVATLTAHYLAPNGVDAVDYRHINFVCAQGVTLLAQQRLASAIDDYVIAALLLDDVLTKRKQDELREVLLTGGRTNPDQLEEAVPYLAQNIRDRQHRSAEYALWVLRRYADSNPEELTHLIDDVAAYLDPEQGHTNPGNPTGFLAAVAPNAPDAVAPYRVQIEALQDHREEYVRDHCSMILAVVDDTNDETERTTDTGALDEASTTPETGLGADAEDTVVSGDEPSNETLRDEAGAAGVESVREGATRTQAVQEYTRSEAVKRYVKARADGRCEGCNEPAPFTSATGDPYLHTHHVNELSDGGSDTPETVIALCPNCHYRVHHGKDGDRYNEELKQTLAEIEPDETTS